LWANDRRTEPIDLWKYLEHGGGLWFLNDSILWTPNGNASNSVDSQQAFQELPQPLESIGFIANRFG
jgi:hypothetical protein